ncbi:stage II sporulation protein M [uncultured Merdimonas sp.]|uniref:stage II sporulation protein M n=1 Tax=uncultured Merdimonas sp. TaxID=2023269 RepID=UPI00320B50F1
MKIREKGAYVLWICMAGFLVGIIYSNLIAKDEIVDMGIFQEYFLTRFTQTDFLSAEFFLFVAKVRFLPAVLLAFLGITRFRKAAAVGMLVWTGFGFGLIMAAAVIKMGVKGLALCLAAFTPHLFFYGAGYLILLWHLLKYPQIRWNYAKTAAVVLFFLCGLLLECYVNPLLLELFLRSL